MIRWRHVFFIEGYDPQGASGYYDLFASSWPRSRKIWHFEGKLGELVLDSEWIAHWDIEAVGPNWQVNTRYEFLRLESVIRSNLAKPMWRQILRALAVALGDCANGTMIRMFRAAWRFGLQLLVIQVLMLLWLLLPPAAGVVAALMAEQLVASGLVAGAVGIGLAILGYVLLWRLAERWYVVRINNYMPYLREFASGGASGFDEPIDVCAARVVAAARDGSADEIVVVGHSTGGVFAPAVIARALELDPDVGRRGPRLLLLTLGSLLPAAALHPGAHRMRDLIARLATEPSLVWIDCVSRKDVLNFWDFDPVSCIGRDLGARRCNPLAWTVRFKDLVSPEYYRRVRWRFLRMHFQFIISGDRRAAYDYVMLVVGPATIPERAAHPEAVAAAFAGDGAFLPASLIGSSASAGAVLGGASLEATRI